MPTISLSMIVKNEEDVLGRCLESIQGLADEIVIVDTGSTDATVAVAKRFTDRVFSFDWVDDFSAARNYAFSLCTCDYCMWLDADDVLLQEERDALLKLKKTLSPHINAVMVKYNTGFDENGNVTFSYYRERIIKNHAGMCWKGAVHEAIEPIGEVLYADCAVTHQKLHPSDPDRNLRIFEGQVNNGIMLCPREQFYYARELYYHNRFRDAVTVLERFLEDGKGWVENNIDACCHLAYCYYGLGREDDALSSLLRSLSYDLPRAEVCCDIGKHFLDRDRYRQAAFWYTIATSCKRDDRRGGFTSPDCYGYIPCIQLCVCYSRMGDMEKAVKFNELASAFKPGSAAVLHNRLYFDSLGGPESESQATESSTL